MSTPAPSSPTMEKDKSKRKSLQRFLTKLVRKPKNRDSVGAESTPTSPTEPTSPTAPTPIEPIVAKPAPPKAETSAAAAAATTSSKQLTPAERAKLIALKHDVELADDWPFLNKQPQGERVEKPIRMRVHRFCHRCEAAFGGEKICPNCQHKRCKNCPRTPAKKEKKKYKKEKDIYAGLTLPNKSGGEPLIHKNIRHRVHWKCHRCENDFGSDTVCKNCQHTRCKRCERDPPKKKRPVYDDHDKDRVKHKRPVKWTCHECQNAHTGSKECSNCGHTRCKTCPRESSRHAREKEAAHKATAAQLDKAMKSLTIAT